MKVLFVDDSRGYLNIIEALLKPFPEIKAVYATDSETALSKMDGVDAVVTDYTLVGETGQAVLDISGDRPVYCLTAHTPTVRMPNNFAGVFSKPSDPREWERLVDALTSNR